MNLSISGQDQPARHELAADRTRILVAAVIEPAAGALCVRASSLHSFLEVNLEIGRGHALAWTHSAEQRGEVGGRSGFGQDCMRGEGVEAGAQTTVKRSVVGSHCRLGSGVKIFNSVVMDHVTVGDKVSLTNCIVCSNAELREGAALANCQVGSSATVEANAQLKNATVEHDE